MSSKIKRLRWILFEIRWDWIRGIEYLLSFPFPRKIGFPNVLIGVFLFSSGPNFTILTLPSPAGNGERESPPPGERSYRRRKLQASACSCEKGLETTGGVKTTPAFEAEVWKIRYPSSLSRPPRLWNGTLITLMGEPNVNYNSKSKREVIRGRWRSEEDGEGEGEGGGWDRARMDGGKGPDEICLRKKGSPWLVLFN